MRTTPPRMRIFATLLAPWLVAGAAACPNGDLERPDADAADVSDVPPFDIHGRLVEDAETSVADGRFACGFFPDTCPDGANCYSVVLGGELQRRCLQYELGSAGDDCTGRRPGECGDGLRCFEGTCRPICDPDGPPRFGCDADSVCIRTRGAGTMLPWGVCLRQTDECSLWPDDDCPKGQNCYALRRGNRCREYDASARIGDSCGSSVDCNDAQICVTREATAGGEGTCRPKCDDDHPCESGTCGTTSDLEFGACFPRADAG